MSTANPGVPMEQPSLEQKIDAAVAEASQLIAPFSAPVATAIAAGAEVEPIISSIIKLFTLAFHHSVKQQTAAQA